jgi:cysteine desulfuration protein SufE
MGVAAYPERLAGILDTLALASDPMARAEMLLSLADRFREVPAEVARRPFPVSHLVPGCESEAYVWGILEPDGTLTLHFAIENPSGVSARALAVILDRGLSGLPAAEVATVGSDVVFEIFRRDISMGKGLGLMSMVRAVQTIARRAMDQSPRPDRQD